MLEYPGIWICGLPNEIKKWTPPFPAMWRANRLISDGDTQSCQHSEISLVNNDDHYFIYPIDRDRSTPLSVYCPIDILRNTLGVGPCQYILDRENLGSGAHPTPNDVTEWIVNLFHRKREKRYKEQIVERLKEMTLLIDETQSRIQQYLNYTENVRDYLDSLSFDNNRENELKKSLDNIVDTMKTVIDRNNSNVPALESINRMGNEIVSLIGENNAEEKCKAICDTIRSIGASQNYTVSKCRIASRWLLKTRKDVCFLITWHGRFISIGFVRTQKQY